MALRQVSVLLVSATLLLGPTSAMAGGSAQPEAEGPVAPTNPEVLEAPADPDDAVLDEAQHLFDEGASKYETADYAGAIELWTRAYGLVPNVPEYGPIRAKLIANLATAQERAYAVDREISHLNQAKILLERYRAGLAEIYGEDDVERAKELAWIAERVGAIDAELQAVADREAAANEPEPEPEREPRLGPGQGMVIGGSVLTGLGVAGLGVMIGGMVIGAGNNSLADIPSNDLDARATRFDQGRLGNTLAIAGGAGGAVLLGAGVALLVVGLAKKRAAGPTEAQATLVPILDPTQAGLGLVGRF
jgi:hypothetical protein